MPPPHPADVEKAAKYAIAASKGFSYYLPRSAQRHVQDVLKQLPSTARPIYDEYYRDLMCAKACAADSAVAMGDFITSSFPEIAREHNAFAREMNGEIEGDEHEGYEPVRFPVVAEMEPEEDGDGDGEESAVRAGKCKRKRALAARAWTAKKKTRTERDGNAVTLSGEPAPSSSDAEPWIAHQPDTQPESRAQTAGSSHAADARRLPCESTSPVDEQTRAGSISAPQILEPYSQDASPLSRASPSAQSLETPVTSPKIGGDSTTMQPVPWRAPSSISPPATHTRASSLVFTAPAVDNTATVTASQPDTASVLKEHGGEDGHVESAFEGGYAVMTEEERWEEGMQALEEFDWGG